MDGRIIKVFIYAVLILVALPFLPYILPKAMTFERIRAGLEQGGFTLQDFQTLPTPGNEAIGQIAMTIDDAHVDVYQYDDEGKIARYHEYQKKDPGQAMVEAWGLAQSLGAAPSKNLPSLAARRRMFLMVATGPDEALLKRIIDRFQKL
jgi:hypothetical protein